MESRPLSIEMSTRYRQLGARANCLATDRGDISFASEEVCRDMSAPTGLSMKALKRWDAADLGQGHPQGGARLYFKYRSEVLERLRLRANPHPS